MKIILVLSILSFTFFSCTQTVDIDFGKTQDKMVISSFIQPDSTLQVLVSYPIGTLESGSPIIKHAHVRLFENDVFVEELQYNNYCYRSTIYPQVNNTYKIEVEAENYPEVQATDHVPDAPLITNVEFIKNYRLEYDDDGDTYNISRVSCKIIDDHSTQNYYEIAVYYKYLSEYDNTYYITSFNYEKNECEIINQEEVIDYRPNSIVFSNNDFNEISQPVNIDLNTSNIFDFFTQGEMIIIVRKVSFAYYQYQKSFTIHNYFQNSDDDLWGSPMPVELFSNVENGLGIFAAYNEVRDTIPVN